MDTPTAILQLATAIELFTTLVFVLAVVFIAMWRRREGFLYLMAVPVAVWFGWYWAGEKDQMLLGMPFAAIGGYCIYLAWRAFKQKE